MSSSTLVSPSGTVFMPTVALGGASPETAVAQAASGGSFDGVVRVSDGVYYGSGTLLSTGRHILTAAHVAESSTADQWRVYFSLLSGIVSVPVTHVYIHPGWSGDSNFIDNDLAILELASPAPDSAQRYDIYTAQDEVGQNFTLAGYGARSGGVADTSTPVRRAGSNTFDMDATRLAQNFGWNISGSKQLAFDFDDGTATHDAFGRYFGLSGLGLGAQEAMMTPGDSGGPAFLQKNGQLLVAGVNSYIARPSGDVADVDSVVNSSFGEFAVEMRVSAYQAWIDAKTGADRVIMGETGTKPDHASVPKMVVEGGTAWFLVEIGAPQTQEVSVHYETRDGTAKAQEDYLPAHGEIVFSPGQTWCKVKIETLSDQRIESNETFSLVLSSPQGGHFGNGQAELSVSRTILNDTNSTVGLIGVQAFDDITI